MREFRTFYQRGKDAYDDGDHITVNPFLKGTFASTQFEKGYWDAYDKHVEESIEEAERRYGMEEAYGNFAEFDYGGDDPSPYSGTYSEE